jgi:hypothetical protein
MAIRVDGTIAGEIHYVASLRGKDGISPVVETSKKDGVTTITITDAEGTKTATVNDGYTPVKGTDYFSEEDKTELVNAVLAKVVDASEEEY